MAIDVDMDTIVGALFVEAWSGFHPCIGPYIVLTNQLVYLIISTR